MDIFYFSFLVLIFSKDECFQCLKKKMHNEVGRMGNAHSENK